MRRSPLILLFLQIFVIAFVHNTLAQDAGSESTSTTTKLSKEQKEERNKKIALANANAIHTRDVETASKDFAPDIMNYGNGKIPPQKGIDAVTASLRMFVATFPIEKIDNLVAVADGDWVMLWGTWSGAWTGDFMGQKATGKSFTKRDVEIYRFNEEGKITEHHSVQSLGEIAQQVGLKIPTQ